MRGSLLIIASDEWDAKIHRREWAHTPEVVVVGPNDCRKIEGLRLRDAVLTRGAEHAIGDIERVAEVAVRSLVLSGSYENSVLLQQAERLRLA